MKLPCTRMHVSGPVRRLNHLVTDMRMSTNNLCLALIAAGTRAMLMILKHVMIAVVFRRP
jgi:hypothetical protein